MYSDWVEVKSFSSLYLAEIAIQILAENNIEGVILNKKDSSYLSFGYVEVYVKKDQLENSKILLADLN
jgi:hypothetical protein